MYIQTKGKNYKKTKKKKKLKTNKKTKKCKKLKPKKKTNSKTNVYTDRDTGTQMAPDPQREITDWDTGTQMTTGTQGIYLLFTLKFRFCPKSLRTTPETQGSFN